MNNIVQIKISGLNLLRIIDKLILANVCVTNVVVKSKSIKFFIEESKLNELDKICKIERKFYKIIQKKGLKQLFLKIPYIFGSILALIILFTYYFSNSLFIYNVNLTYKSNSDYDLSTINNLLVNNGIVSGMSKKNFLEKDIKNIIMLSVDDIEDCDVEYKGNLLNICIYPAVKKYEVTAENIYSNYDAVIEQAEAYVGILKIKAGDIVKKGDLLIENNLGASGKIRGKVYFVATKIYNENQQIVKYTGREYITKDYSIFNKFIIKSKNYCDFKQFYVENCTFSINKNIFIPIICNKKIYKEIIIEDIVVPFSDVENKIKEETYNEALKKVNNFNDITNVSYSVVKEGSYIRVDCFIETIMDLI